MCAVLDSVFPRSISSGGLQIWIPKSGRLGKVCSVWVRFRVRVQG